MRGHLLLSELKILASVKLKRSEFLMLKLSISLSLNLSPFGWGRWTFSKSPKGLSSAYTFRPFQKWLKQHPVGDSQIKYSLMLFWRIFSMGAHKAEFRIRKFNTVQVIQKKKIVYKWEIFFLRVSEIQWNSTFSHVGAVLRSFSVQHGIQFVSNMLINYT